MLSWSLLCWPVIVKMESENVSHSVVSTLVPHRRSPQAPLSIEFSRQEYWSGSHSFLQGIFQTHESNPHFLHFRQISLLSGLSECWDQFVIFIKITSTPEFHLLFPYSKELSMARTSLCKIFFFNFNNFLIIKTNIKDSQLVQF